MTWIKRHLAVLTSNVLQWQLHFSFFFFWLWFWVSSLARTEREDHVSRCKKWRSLSSTINSSNHCWLSLLLWHLLLAWIVMSRCMTAIFYIGNVAWHKIVTWFPRSIARWDWKKGSINILSMSLLESARKKMSPLIMPTTDDDACQIDSKHNNTAATNISYHH